MRYGVLGTLEIRRPDGALLDVPGAKERLLLCVLAAAFPDAVSVDQLVEQLWDGDPPRTARKSLQAHVVRLRTALEPDRPPGSSGRYVVRRHAGYALALERDQLDATEFVDQVARGRALLAAGEPEPAGALLEEALALWRGTPFLEWPDSPELERERQRLKGIHDHATEAYWQAELALGRHSEAVPELERMVAEQPLHENLWAMLALAQYRCGRQGEALDALRRARVMLAEELGVDPGSRLRALESAVLAQDPDLDLDPGPPSPQPPAPPPTRSVQACPYKGLARYEMEDADSFRGRDHLVRTLLTALVDHRMIVVSGSSGAGKSSVVRAGLLPALGTGAVPGSESWRPLVVAPGLRAVDSLAAVSRLDEGEPVALVCDQLEQLWSPGTSPGERVAFLDTVLGLLEDDVVARAVLVVRGDHLGRLAEHADLAQRMLGGLVMVPPMTEVELRQVVVDPAVAAGLAVEPDLSDVAVRDVLGRSGALPLLSTALAQTWLHRRNGVLTLAGYLATGGVTRAVGRSAEQVFDSLTDEEQQQARRILVRLAEQDEEGTVRARQLPVAELTTGTDPELTERVVERFVSSRLLSRDGGYLEVAHEALLTAWPRLSTWLDEDAVGRAVRRHLAPAALDWAAHGRPADELYRGARLEAAAQWVDTPGSGPTELEREYVDAGLAQAEAELTAARDRASAEAAGRRRTRRFATMLAAALVLALVATAVALFFQDRADDRATAAREAGVVSDANRLAAVSKSARALDLSLLLAAAAVRTEDTPATRDSLLSALIEHRRATAVHQLALHGVQETALSANGRTLMATVGGGEPQVLVWRPGRTGSPKVLDEWWPESLDVSDDGRTLVASGSHPDRDGVFAYSAAGDRLWSVDARRLGGYPLAVGFTKPDELLVVSGQERRGGAGYQGLLSEVDTDTGTVTRVGRLGHTTADDAFLAASFSDDGDGLVVHGSDGRAAWLRNVSTGRVTPLALARRDAASLDFVALPGGESAQLWSDGALTRYAKSGRAVQELDVHRAAVRDVRVLPGGAMAVTTGDDGQVVLWDVDRQGHWSFGETLEGHSGPVVQAEVSADADSLLTASADGQVVTWDLTADAGLGSTYPGLEGENRYVSNRVEVVDPGRLVVAPTRTLSKLPRGVTETPGPDTLSVAAVFIDPRTGRVLDEVVVGDTFDSLFGSSVAVSPDRQWVSVSTSFSVSVIDAKTRKVVDRVLVPDTFTSDSNWSADGDRLIVAQEEFFDDRAPAGRISVVEPGSWEVERTVPLKDGTPQVLEWSRDRQTLAVGVNYTATVGLFDRQLREQRIIELGEGGDVFDLSFSPDGRYLAAGRGGGVLTVLDTRDWKPVHGPVTMHAEPISDVEWLPDSNTVVSSGRDEIVSLYDVERDLVRGSGLPASARPGDGYTFLLPNPEDEVVVFNEGGPGHVYPLDPARWLALACTVAGRDLTRAEWARYLPGRPYRPVCDLSRDQQSSPG